MPSARDWIGRRHVRDAVNGLVDALPAGGIVVLEGEPGIGKSVLLDLATRRASERGFRSVSLHADEVSRGCPYGIFAAADLAERQMTLLTADDIFDARMSAGGDDPFLVTIDDLQWVDSSSARLLPTLARRIVSAGGGMVVAMRSGSRTAEVDALIDKLGSLRPVHVVVEPLADEEIDELAAQILDPESLADSRPVLRRAGGNPMYAILLASALRRGGDSIENLLDAGVGAAVVRRARLLAEPTFSVLRAASVLGRHLEPELLALITGISLREVLEAVTTAHGDGLLQDDENGGLSFRHDLVREALLGDLAGPVRAELHRRAIDAMIETRTPPARLIPHLLAVDATPADCDVLVAGAMTATPAIALTLIDRAIALVDPADPRFAEMSVRRVDALMSAGGLAESLHLGRSLLDEPIGDEHAFAIQTTRIRALYVTGRAGEAVDTHRFLPDTAPRSMRTRELADLTIAATIARRFDQARQFSQTAIELSSEPADLAFAYGARAWTELRSGRMDLAEDYIARSFEMGERAAAVHAPNAQLVIRAVVRQAAGDWRGALIDVQRAIATAADEGSRLSAPFLHASASIALFDAGRWDDAYAEFGAGLSACDEFNAELARGTLAVGQLIELYRDGHTKSPLGLGVAAVSIVDDRRRYSEAVARELDGDLHGAFEVLRAFVEADVEVGDRSPLVLAGPDYVRLAVDLGITARQDEVIAALDRIDISRDAPARMALAWARALRDRSAVNLIEIASEHAELRPFDAARIREQAAELLVAERKTDLARAEALAALDVYQQLGAHILERRVLARMREHGIRLRSSSRSKQQFGWDAITDTERQILGLVADGLSNQAIADRLVMSRRTVESHLAHVYSKVGIDSRIHLVRALIDRAS